MVRQVRDDAFGALAGAPDASEGQGGRALCVAVPDPDAACFAIEEALTDRR